MARPVKIMMDAEERRTIARLPDGSRIRAVNVVISDWSGTSNRREASVRMHALRVRLPTADTDRNVRWIRQEREQPS